MRDTPMACGLGNSFPMPVGGQPDVIEVMATPWDRLGQMAET